jgi:hypothetical protein
LGVVVARVAIEHQRPKALQAVYGTAELLNGSGWLFRRDGERKAVLVSYKDPNLVLYGLVDVADAQYDVDLLVGGPAMVACSRQEGRQ